MSEEEILKACETVIYRQEAYINRLIQKAKRTASKSEAPELAGEIVTMYEKEAGYLVDLRQRVQYWRKTGKLLP